MAATKRRSRRIGGPIAYNPKTAPPPPPNTHAVVWTRKSGVIERDLFPHLSDAKVYAQSLYRVGVAAIIIEELAQ